jgi:hypothetical protein
MSHPTAISPREEALRAILQTREVHESGEHMTIDLMTWDRLVAIAWDNRSEIGDRREVQRELRSALLAGLATGGDDATS